MLDEMLTYTANVYTTAETKNELGTVSKSRVLLYENMKCRLLNVRSGWRPNIGGSEESQEKFKIVCPKNYSGAKQGDEVEIDGRTFTISREPFPQRDETGVNHYVYFLLEHE